MRVLLYGANGQVGRLVALALARNGLSSQLALAGRDREQLEAVGAELGGAVPVWVAPLYEPGPIAAAVAGADLVLQCAGPLDRIGEVVLRAALDARANYLDASAEQWIVRDLYERYESAARRAGQLVVSACGVQGALADWAAALVGEALGASPDRPLDELVVGHAIGGTWGMLGSSGVRRSMLASLERPLWVWRDARWHRVEPGGDVRSFGFPAPIGSRVASSFPGPEVITIPRHVACARVQGYLAAEQVSPAAARLLGPMIPAVLRSVLGPWTRARVADGAPGPTAGQRAVIDFAVVVEGRRGFDSARVAVTGVDPYGVTAEIVALCAEQVAGGTPQVTGVRAPAEAFEPSRCLDALVSRCGLGLHRSYS